jgi:hypothetical protein
MPNAGLSRPIPSRRGSGASASVEAKRQRLLAAAYEQAALEATRKARSYGVAGRTDAQTTQALAPLRPSATTSSTIAPGPGSKRANVDLLLIGSSGCSADRLDDSQTAESPESWRVSRHGRPRKASA